MTEKKAIEILSHMATISDLAEGEEHAQERTETVSMAIAALTTPKKIGGMAGKRLDRWKSGIL